MSHFVQAAILICSSSAAFLVTSKATRARRIGFFIGLAGQPFWFYTAWQNRQWAIFMLSFWYSFCYGRGIWSTRRHEA